MTPSRYTHPLYQEDLDGICCSAWLPWSKLEEKHLLLSE